MDRFYNEKQQPRGFNFHKIIEQIQAIMNKNILDVFLKYLFYIQYRDKDITVTEVKNERKNILSNRLRKIINEIIRN